ncbi:MAG: PIN domain-containing protein, partial [Pseudonocardiaceae bacterium]
VLRTDPKAELKSRQILERLRTIPFTPDLLEQAATAPPPQLRSLDAIHLASASQISRRITAFIAYDTRLATAAEGSGLPVVMPR